MQKCLQWTEIFSHKSALWQIALCLSGNPPAISKQVMKTKGDQVKGSSRGSWSLVARTIWNRQFCVVRSLCCQDSSLLAYWFCKGITWEYGPWRNDFQRCFFQDIHLKMDTRWSYAFFQGRTIANAVNCCACYMFNPWLSHKKALKQIGRFLKATIETKVWCCIRPVSLRLMLTSMLTFLDCMGIKGLIILLVQRVVLGFYLLFLIVQ